MSSLLACVQLGWDKSRFEMYRDAIFSIIGTLLALSMDPDSFFHGGNELVSLCSMAGNFVYPGEQRDDGRLFMLLLWQVPVIAAYIAGFFVTGVLFIVNFTMIHHIAQLTSRTLAGEAHGIYR